LGEAQKTAERDFEHAVDPPQFLFFTQLYTIFSRFFPAALPVLTWRVRPPLNCTLVGIAPLPFEKELNPFPPAHAAYRAYISSHKNLLILPLSVQVERPKTKSDTVVPITRAFVSAGDSRYAESASRHESR